MKYQALTLKAPGIARSIHTDFIATAKINDNKNIDA